MSDGTHSIRLAYRCTKRAKSERCGPAGGHIIGFTLVRLWVQRCNRCRWRRERRNGLVVPLGRLRSPRISLRLGNAKSAQENYNTASCQLNAKAFHDGSSLKSRAVRGIRAPRWLRFIKPLLFGRDQFRETQSSFSLRKISKSTFSLVYGDAVCSLFSLQWRTQKSRR